MFRPTRTQLVLPLPLYKVGIVMIRQFSRPAVAALLSTANEYPMVRSGLIAIGWWHFRTAVSLQRIVWGEEQKAVEEKIKEADEKIADPLHENQQQQANNSADKNNKSADGSNAKPAEKPCPLSSVSVPAQTPTIRLGGINIGGASPAVNLEPEPKSTTTTTAATPQQQQFTTNVVRAIPSPRSLKILPRSLNPMVQVRNVRRIFVAPPRPSDEELIKKGMQLIVEVSLILLLCLLLLFEMWKTNADKAKKKEVLEARFKRLEDHMLNCPGALFDEAATAGNTPPASPTKTSTSSAAVAAATSGGAKTAAAATAASSSTAPDLASKSAAPSANNNNGPDGEIVDGQKFGIDANGKKIPIPADSISLPLIPKPKKQLWIVVMAQQMHSLTDLLEAFMALPQDIRAFLCAFLFVPYVVFGFAAMRLMLTRA